MLSVARLRTVEWKCVRESDTLSLPYRSILQPPCLFLFPGGWSECTTTMNSPPSHFLSGSTSGKPKQEIQGKEESEARIFMPLASSPLGFLSLALYLNQVSLLLSR